MSKDNLPSTETPAPAAIPLLTIDQAPPRIAAEFSNTSLLYFWELVRRYGRPDPASPNYEGELVQNILARRELLQAMETPPIQEQVESAAPEDKGQEDFPPC